MLVSMKCVGKRVFLILVLNISVNNFYQFDRGLISIVRDKIIPILLTSAFALRSLNSFSMYPSCLNDTKFLISVLFFKNIHKMRSRSYMFTYCVGNWLGTCLSMLQELPIYLALSLHTTLLLSPFLKRYKYIYSTPVVLYLVQSELSRLFSCRIGNSSRGLATTGN